MSPANVCTFAVGLVVLTSSLDSEAACVCCLVGSRGVWAMALPFRRIKGGPEACILWRILCVESVKQARCGKTGLRDVACTVRYRMSTYAFREAEILYAQRTIREVFLFAIYGRVVSTARGSYNRNTDGIDGISAGAVFYQICQHVSKRAG